MTNQYWRRNLLLISMVMIDASWMSLALITLASALFAQPWYILFLITGTALILLTSLARWLAEQPFQWWVYNVSAISVLFALILLAVIVFPRNQFISSDSVLDVLMVPPSMVAAAAAMLLWWRGFGLGQKAATFLQAGLNFRVGMLLMLALGGLAPLSRQVDAIFLIGCFFFFGLLASAAARVEAKGQLAGVEQPLSPTWAGILSLISLGTVAASLLVERLLPGAMRLIGRLLQPVWSLLLRLLGVFVVWLTNLLEPFFLWLKGLIGNSTREVSPLPAPIAIPTRIPEPTDSPGLLERILPILAKAALAIVALIIVAGLIYLLTLFLKQRRRQRRDDLAELHTVQKGASSSDENVLSAAWNRLRDWANLVARYGLGTRLYTALSVRTMYANVVRLATARGFPRQHAWTPYDYLSTLQQAFPEGEEAALLLTDAYVSVHYGQTPESREALQSIRQAYDSLYQIAADATSRPT